MVVDFDVKAISKELTFHVGGFVLHNYFWTNIGPTDTYGEEPTGTIAECI
jgi:Fe-Mn family superoxide dismutase